MSMKTLNNLRKVVAEVVRKEDCDCLSVADLKSLQTLLGCEIQERSHRDFLTHINKTMPVADCDNYDAEWDKFIQIEWTISFNGQTITIDNCAQVYQGIYDMLSDYIDEVYDVK